MHRNASVCSKGWDRPKEQPGKLIAYTNGFSHHKNAIKHITADFSNKNFYAQTLSVIDGLASGRTVCARKGERSVLCEPFNWHASLFQWPSEMQRSKIWCCQFFSVRFASSSSFFSIFFSFQCWRISRKCEKFFHFSEPNAKVCVNECEKLVHYEGKRTDPSR